MSKSKSPADAANHRINETIRMHLARQRASQTALAAHVHLSQAAISRRLAGRKSWSIGELADVADYLGVPMSMFFDDGLVTS